MTISLHELSEKIGEDPSLESMMSMVGVYMEYVESIDKCATEVLNGTSGDDLKTALDVIRSVAIADALSDGVLNGNQLKFLMSDSFVKVAAIIFKLSVGLAVVEELR